MANAANCENQPWEGKVRKPAANLRETRRKHRKLAGNLQETCRKPAGNLWKTWKPGKPKGNPPKNLGKVTREGNLYEAQTNL